MEPKPSHTPPPEATCRPSPAAAADSAHSSNGHSPTTGDALKQAAGHLGELKEYASLYVAAKLDSFKLTMRNLLLYVALGIVGAIVGVGLLITAAALFLTGLAGGIGAIFNPDRPWVGALIVGFLVLAGAIGGVVLVIRKLTGASRKATVDKYELLKREQRSTYGHDVQERAREQEVRKPTRQETRA